MEADQTRQAKNRLKRRIGVDSRSPSDLEGSCGVLSSSSLKMMSLKPGVPPSSSRARFFLSLMLYE